MQSRDVDGVVALAAKEPKAPHWPPAEYHRMLRVIRESFSRRGAWVLLLQAREAVVHAEGRSQPSCSASGPDHDLGAISSAGGAGEIAGFAMAIHVAGVCDLEAVVVETAWRGRRLGSALVEAAAAWGRALGASRLQLEVRASNTAAIRLYERMGFTPDGSRPGYYRSPDEEAVLMSLLLEPGENGREGQAQ